MLSDDSTASEERQSTALLAFKRSGQVQCLLKKSTGRATGTERAQQAAPTAPPQASCWLQCRVRPGRPLEGSRLDRAFTLFRTLVGKRTPAGGSAVAYPPCTPHTSRGSETGVRPGCAAACAGDRHRAARGGGVRQARPREARPFFDAETRSSGGFHSRLALKQREHSFQRTLIQNKQTQTRVNRSS